MKELSKKLYSTLNNFFLQFAFFPLGAFFEFFNNLFFYFFGANCVLCKLKILK